MNSIAAFYSDQARLPSVHVEQDPELGRVQIALRDTSGAFEYEMRMTMGEALALEELLSLAIARLRQFTHDQLKAAA